MVNAKLGMNMMNCSTCKIYKRGNYHKFWRQHLAAVCRHVSSGILLKPLYVAGTRVSRHLRLRKVIGVPASRVCWLPLNFC